MINLIDESANIIEFLPQGVCKLLNRAISFHYMSYKNRLDNEEFLSEEYDIETIYKNEKIQIASLIKERNYENKYINLIAECRKLEKPNNEAQIFYHNLISDKDNYKFFRLAVNALKLDEQRQYQESELTSGDLIDNGVDSIKLPHFMSIVDVISVLGHYLEVKRCYELYSSKIWKLERNLNNLGFQELPKIKNLSFTAKKELLRIIDMSNPAYQVAMYDFLGFMSFLESRRGLSKGAIHKIFNDHLYIDGQRMAKEWQALKKESEWNKKDKKNQRFKSLKFKPIVKYDYKKIVE